MEFWGFGLVGAYKDRPHADALNDELNLVEFADRKGLDGWFFAEHHINPEYSLCPSPNLLVANAAARTKRLRLGVMVNVLPYYHPLRAAEEIRTLDVLTGGRLEMGFGRGQVRIEQQAFGVDRSSTVAMFEQSVAIIARLLRGETVDIDTPWWKGRGAKAMPDGVQQDGPPLWMSAASDTSIDKSARLGLNCATALLTRNVADERMSQYRRAWDAYHPSRKGQGRFAIAATVSVGQSRDTAYRRIQRDFEKLRDHFAHAITDKPGSDDSTYLSHEPTYRAFAASTFESMLADHLVIAGTVDDCQRQLREVHRRGIDVLICSFHHAACDYRESLRSFELFATEVIPVVRGTQTTIKVTNI